MDLLDSDPTARDSCAVRRINTLLFALLVVGTLIGCHSAPKEEPPAPATLAFEKRLHDNGSVTFRSWNGKAHRMNSDTELTFLPNNVAQMLEWRLSVVHYDGTYHLDRDGHITASFDDYQAKWPVTVCELQNDTLLLRPIDPDAGYLVGQQGATYIPDRDSGFWPFRMLLGDDEQKVLQRMHQRVDAPQP